MRVEKKSWKLGRAYKSWQILICTPMHDRIHPRRTGGKKRTWMYEINESFLSINWALPITSSLLRSWSLWPGFLLVACQGPGFLSKPYREIANSMLIFNGSQTAECAQIQSEETLCVSLDQTATPKVTQSQAKFMKNNRSSHSRHFILRNTYYQSADFKPGRNFHGNS